MRIRRLQLADFRRYRELDIELAPGLTVVRGPNEAGKTTIQRAIELALTRRVTSTAGDLEALRPWDAPTEAPLDRAHRVRAGRGGRPEARHRSRRRSPARKGHRPLDYDGQSITDPTLADQVLAELTGIPTEAFFRSTASVRHHELDDLARDEAALRDRLQASISGADRGTSRARKKLDKALHDLRHKGDKNPGRLKVAEQAVAQAQAAVEQGEPALAQLERDRDALAGAHDRRADAEAALAERRSMLEKARQAERLMAERDAAQERYERYRQAVEVTAEIDALAATHPSPNPLPVVRAGVERLRALDVPRPRAPGGARGRGARSRSRSRRSPRPGGPSRGVVDGADRRRAARSPVAAVAATLLGVADLGPIPAIAGGIIAVVGAVLGGVAFGRRRSNSDAAASCATSRSTGGCAAGPRWRRSSSRWSRNGAPTRSARARRPGRGRGRCSRARRPTSRQIDRLDRPARRAGRQGAARDARQARATPRRSRSHRRRAPSRPSARSPRSRAPASGSRSRSATRRRALERARDDEANARARVEANTVDAEQVAGQAERLAVWHEQLAALAAPRSASTHRPSRPSIGAEQATMKTATRYLEQRMVGTSRSSTGGRYRHVRVDDKTLDIEVRAPEKRRLGQGHGR